MRLNDKTKGIDIVSDIFDEVEEDLRKDKAEELWKKYGNYVIALAVLIVVGTAGYKGWQAYDASVNEDLANRFDQAVQMGRAENYEQADGALAQLVQDGNASYAALSRLQQAALKSKSGDVEGAIVIYDALALDSAVESLYRDLAVVMSVMHQVDTGDASQLLEMVDPQTTDIKPWRFTARELAAVLAMKKGDKTLAADYLTRITDDADAPQSARLRAGELLKVVEG
ncbi:tetratricopeptide repeat protein [Rhodospirillaceae bacterium RKSG073]|nr:tetratricopeptide repeat protein [Curvivirga aplysinae]